MNIRHTAIVLCLLLALPICGKVKTKVMTNAPQAAYAASRLEAADADLSVTIEIAGSGSAEVQLFHAFYFITDILQGAYRAVG